MKTKKILQTPEELNQIAEELLKPWTVSTKSPENDRLDVTIDAKDIQTCTKAIMDANWGYLSAITGLDNAEYEVIEGTTEKKAIPGKGSLELLYHFCSGAAIVSLRTSLPYTKAQIDTICNIIPSASLYERETAELFGIDFVGTPSTEHLLLPDDWPAEVYPLRKTFTGLEKKAKA